jgi:hypothetical protein
MIMSSRRLFRFELRVAMIRFFLPDATGHRVGLRGRDKADRQQHRQDGEYNENGKKPAHRQSVSLG